MRPQRTKLDDKTKIDEVDYAFNADNVCRLKSGFSGLRPTDGLRRPNFIADGWSAKADHWRTAPEASEFTRLVPQGMDCPKIEICLGLQIFFGVS